MPRIAFIGVSKALLKGKCQGVDTTSKGVVLQEGRPVAEATYSQPLTRENLASQSEVLANQYDDDWDNLDDCVCAGRTPPRTKGSLLSESNQSVKLTKKRKHQLVHTNSIGKQLRKCWIRLD